MPNKYSLRFAELTAEAEKLLSTKKGVYDHTTNQTYEQVDVNALTNWRVKAKHLISAACGEESQHFKAFVDVEKAIRASSANAYRLGRLMAVFRQRGKILTAGISALFAVLFKLKCSARNWNKPTNCLSAGTKLPLR